MMDRYSITKGMYNAFDHRITVKNLEDTPVFYHEYYHHIQNVSTILGGERLNLLMQFLGHATSLAHSDIPLKAPFNRWYEQGVNSSFDTPELKRRLDNLVQHQDLWLYLDKVTYPLKFFKSEDCLDANLATIPTEDEEALEPYIIRSESGMLVGYPIGGFAITESGAYALELWHSQNFDPAILKGLNPENYQYLIVLEMVYRLIGDFRLSCLATFLLCDLAMIISTPSMGFLAIYQTAKYFFREGVTAGELLKWYESTYQANLDLINDSIESEMKVIRDVRTNKVGLNIIMDNMIEWQLGLMERGLKLRLSDRLVFIKRLLSGTQEDLDYLVASFPPSIIETTDDGNVIYSSDDDFTNYELLNACYNIYLGLCRDVDHILNNEAIIHTKRLDKHRFIFDLQTDGNDSDSYGYMLHSMGLVNKPITILT